MRKDKNDNCSSILVTGNLGYIGTVLVPMLNSLKYSVTGYDSHFYDSSCQLYEPEQKPNKQILKDIRDIEKDDLKGIDGIIHLASLSNDPLGEFNPNITYEINYSATVRLAEIAEDCCVKRFVYASSQSMYGVANIDKELDEDESEKNPVTAYAKTKWMAECELKKMGTEDFVISFFRPSTVFGVSPKLRCDIVFNNFVGCAYTTGKIEIKSDGTPWRPVIHINDVSNAFISGLTAPKELIMNEAFNIGLENGNFTVRQLAEAAQKVVHGSSIIFTGVHGKDSRTYRVSFNRILSILKDYFKPEWNLINGGKQLVELFDKIGFTEDNFRSIMCNRLLCLKKLIESKVLNDDLRWIIKK